MPIEKETKVINQSLWDDFLTLLPADTAEIAARIGIMKGARQDKDLWNAIRVQFMHFSSGMSLKETVTRGKLSGLCNMSAVALHHRLIKFGPFYKELCQKLLDRSYQMNFGDHLKIVDATDIREPGPTGSAYRLHTEFSLPSLCIDTMKLTSVSGRGTGESFCQFKIKEGDIFVGDRGYCRAPEITHVVANKANVLVRYNYGTLPLYQKDGTQLSLTEALKELKAEGDCAQWQCRIVNPNGAGVIEGRICAVRKSEDAIRKAHRKCKKTSRKCGFKPQDTTLFINEFMIVFTTLPEKEFSLKKVLELYRWRWQIELVFKRLKSLLQLGCLPKTTGHSAVAWLYGKMLLALLIEKISIQGCAFSPWRECKSKDDIQRILVANL